jgi:hypothetical protein
MHRIGAVLTFPVAIVSALAAQSAYDGVEWLEPGVAKVFCAVSAIVLWMAAAGREQVFALRFFAFVLGFGALITPAVVGAWGGTLLYLDMAASADAQAVLVWLQATTLSATAAGCCIVATLSHAPTSARRSSDAPWRLPAALLLFACVVLKLVLIQINPPSTPDEPGEGGALQAFAAILQYLGPILAALVVWGAMTVSRRTADERWLVRLLCMALLIGIFAVGQNRASIAIPALALIAVGFRSLRRDALAFVVVVVTFTALIAVVTYMRERTSAEAAGGTADVLADIGISAGDAVRLGAANFVHLYFAGPSLFAYPVELAMMRAWPAGELPNPTHSLLAPVPVVGKEFRAFASNNVVNSMIYGRNSWRDQLMPPYVELQLQGSSMYPLIGYFAFGGLLAARARRRTSPVAFSFAAQVVGLYAAWGMVQSLQSLGQFLVWVIGPVLVGMLIIRFVRTSLLGPRAGVAA